MWEFFWGEVIAFMNNIALEHNQFKVAKIPLLNQKNGS